VLPVDALNGVLLSRLKRLDSHLESGDEWNLLWIEPEDLALPPSTRSLTISRLDYLGDLVLSSRSAGSSVGEARVEYKFRASVVISAVMAVPDALANGWSRERIAEKGLVLVNTSLPVVGVVGMEHEDGDDLGGIEYIRIGRDVPGARPTPGSLSHVPVERSYRSD
jgi:hypothetical protein